MSTTVNLIPFADFPASERDALLAVLHRLGLAPAQVCITRLQPASDASALPAVALVSAPGWWRSYEGEQWIPRVEQDLSELVRSWGGAAHRALAS
jgi:hypothetical protein